MPRKGWVLKIGIAAKKAGEVNRRKNKRSKIASLVMKITDIPISS